MYYNLPQNVTGIIGVFSYANSVTTDLFTVLLSYSIFIILLITIKMKGYRTSDAMFYSFFIAFFLSSLLWTAGILASKHIMLLLLFTILSGLYSYIDE